MDILELDNMEYSSNTLAQAAYVTNAPAVNLLSNGDMETWATDTMSNILANPSMDAWGTTELLANNTFETWTSATACTSWTLWNASSGGTLNREATIVKAGTYSAKVTSTGTACGTYQIIDTAGGHTQAYWKGRTITWGAWVYATVPNYAHLSIWDSVSGGSSAFHTGNSTWQYLTCTFTAASTSTAIYCVCLIEVGVSTSAYFDNASCPEIVNLPLNPGFETWTGLTNLFTNGDFETYTTTPGPPDSWAAATDGSGGSAAKETTEKKVGSNSCKITPVTSGSCYYIYQVPSCTAYRGMTCVLGVWVKSANTVANAIQIFFSDNGTGQTWKTTYYQNSGGWEYLTVSTVVTATGTSFYTQLRVNQANAPAYFDSAILYKMIPPTSWNISGSPTSATTLFREESKIKSGTYSVRYDFTYTSSGNYGDVYQDITNLGGHNITYWRGKTITFGCWVWANNATAGIYMSDSVTAIAMAWHTGNSTWQWLQVTGIVAATASSVVPVLAMRNTSGTATAYYDDFMAYDTIPPAGGGVGAWTLDNGTVPTSTAEPNTSIVHTAGGCSTKLTMLGWVDSGDYLDLYQEITNLGGHNIAYWRGKKVTVGCWVYATVANRVRIGIYDTDPGTDSPFHTGNSTWQYLTVTATIGVTATAAYFKTARILGGNTVAYFDDAIAYENICPTGWTSDGKSTDGSYVERASNIGVISYSGKLTRVSNDCWLNYVIVSATPYLNKPVTLGAWVYATVANRAYVSIFDGVGSTNSSYHRGDSTWQWLQVTRTVSGSATIVSSALYVTTGDTSAYIDNAQLVDGTARLDSTTGLQLLQSFSESTIKTQGSYSLRGFAAMTSSLNKTLTKTFTTNSNLTNVNRIKFDIRASRTGSNIKIGIHDTGGTTTEITPNIRAIDTWQTVSWDLSSVSAANKDNISTLIITILNADADNTFYIDYAEIEQAANIFGAVN